MISEQVLSFRADFGTFYSGVEEAEVIAGDFCAAQ
jgi:hypothetical protein